MRENQRQENRATLRQEDLATPWRSRGLVFVMVFMTAIMLSVSAHAKSPLLVIRSEGKDFEHAVSGLREELEEEFSLSEMIIDRQTPKERIASEIGNISPKLVILMDNISISLYKKYRRGLPAGSRPLPSVSLMASFAELAIRGLENAGGVSYEVPVVTSVVTLRTVLPAMSFAKVGIVHRKFMSDSVEADREYCVKEEIQLVPFRIAEKGDLEDELEKGLGYLRKREGIDALWVPNDSKIVNAELLRSVWFPFAKNFGKPIIVGVETLVNPRFDFGTFAVIPDHVQLGSQAAEMVFDIADNGWKVPKDGKVVPPRSVYKVINLRQTEGMFHVDKEKLQNVVDKVLR